MRNPSIDTRGEIPRLLEAFVSATASSNIGEPSYGTRSCSFLTDANSLRISSENFNVIPHVQ